MKKEPKVTKFIDKEEENLIKSFETNFLVPQIYFTSQRKKELEEIASKTISLKVKIK